MSKKLVLFSHKVCGKRTAEFVSMHPSGCPTCKIGDWTFVYEGKYTFVDEGDNLPQIPEATAFVPVAVARKAALRPPVAKAKKSVNVDLRSCCCGCGGLTASLFNPGHDTKALSRLRSANGNLDLLPEILRGLVTNNQKWAAKWQAIQEGKKVH